mmetsp:Transcript_43183/g.134975  ORF Transcript_43183/g.134975 Transcript_43183/m.134975 type:complete len:114 (+) Transcript_43183:1258-1599(+)
MGIRRQPSHRTPSCTSLGEPERERERELEALPRESLWLSRPSRPVLRPLLLPEDLEGVRDSEGCLQRLRRSPSRSRLSPRRPERERDSRCPWSAFFASLQRVRLPEALPSSQA